MRRKRVFKYGPLGIGVLNKVTMPAGAKILHFDRQAQRCYVWAEVDIPSEIPNTISPAEETRYLTVVGTGWDYPIKGTHLGSWVSDDRVWHAFEFSSEDVNLSRYWVERK